MAPVLLRHMPQARQQEEGVMPTQAQLERLQRAYLRVVLAKGYNETSRLLEKAKELEARIFADTEASRKK